MYHLLFFLFKLSFQEKQGLQDPAPGSKNTQDISMAASFTEGKKKCDKLRTVNNVSAMCYNYSTNTLQHPEVNIIYKSFHLYVGHVNILKWA